MKVEAGARESLTISLLNTKTSDEAVYSNDQTKMVAAFRDKTKMSSQNKVKAAKKPRPENAESQWEHTLVC